MFKRLLSLLITVTMLVSLVPAGVFAEGDAVVTDTPEQVVVQPEPEKEEPKQEEKAPEAPVEEKQEPETPAVVEEELETEPEMELEEELVADEYAEAIAAATQAIAALPEEMTWAAFDAVEAAGAALAAVPAERQAEVEGADKLTAAVQALLAIYGEAQAALDPAADIWENQHAIKAFAQMKAQMDAALYVKADADMELMGEPADMSWVLAAMDAYANAVATIIPDGADGDMSLMATANDFDDLQKAFGAVKGKETIKINRDIEINEQITAGNDEQYTINTNKKNITVTGTQETGITFAAGTVTINGNGAFIANGAQINALIRVGGRASVTINNVNMTATNAYISGKTCGALWVSAGGTLTVNSGTITAHETVSGKADASGIIAWGDATAKANVTVNKGVKIDADTGVFALNESNTVITGAEIKGTRSGIEGNGKSEHKNASVTLTDTDITVTQANGTGIYFPSTQALTMNGGSITAGTGIEIKNGKLEVSNATITATGNGASPNYNNGNGTSESGDGIVVIANDAYTAGASVEAELTNVTINSEKQNAITVHRTTDAAKTISVTINGSTLNAAGKSIFASGLSEADIAAITIANTTASPALLSGSYTLAAGQNLYTAEDGGSVVAENLNAALALDSVKLTANYTGETVEIPAGKTLETGTYTLDAEVDVKGTLSVGSVDGLTRTATFTPGTRLIVNGVLYIASEDDKLDGKSAVFGLRKNAVMTAVKNAEGGITFTLTAGEGVVQAPIAPATQFELPLNYKFEKSGGTMWLSEDLDVKSLRGFANNDTLSYVVAQIGKTPYKNLADAIAQGGTVKVMRNVTGEFAIKATISVTRAVTLDLQGYTVEFMLSDTVETGLNIADIGNAKVTIQNGSLLANLAASQTKKTTDIIRVNNATSVTLNNVKAELNYGGTDYKVGRIATVVSGGVLNAINNSSLTSQTIAVMVDQGGTFNATGITMTGNRDGFAVATTGSATMPAKATLNNVTIDGTVQPGSYSTMTITNSTINGTYAAVFGNGTYTNTDVTISGSELNATNTTVAGNACAVYAPSDGTWNISNTTIKSTGEGVEVKDGNVTLTNVTIEAGVPDTTINYNNDDGTSGGGEALLVIGNTKYNTSAINVTVTGSSLSSKGGHAVTYGYADGTTASNSALNISINGTTIVAEAASKKPINNHNGAAVTVAVGDITTTPSVDKANINVVGGQFAFETTSGVSSSTYVRKTLSEVVAQAKKGTTIYLDDHTSTSEVVEVPYGVSLELNNNANLVVGSLFIHGKVVATKDGSSIQAANLQVLADKANEVGELNITSIGQLAASTKAEVIACHPAGSSAYVSGKVKVGDTYVFTFDDDTSKQMFSLGDAAHVSVAAREGTPTAMDIQIISGAVEISSRNNAGQHIEFDIGENYLTIAGDATVTVADGVTVKASTNITGDVMYSDVAELTVMLAGLPEDPTKLTYKEYDAVEAAIKLYGDVVTNGHSGTSDAQTAKTNLDKYTAVYLQKYIETYPYLFYVTQGGGDLIVGTTSEVITTEISVTVPQKVKDLLQGADATYALNYTLKEAAAGFSLTTAGNAVVAAGGTELNTTATVTVTYAETAQVENKSTSMGIDIEYRAVPSMAGAILSEAVLGSYNETVNLKNKSQDITIPVSFAYNNGMSYDPADTGYEIVNVVVINGTLGIESVYDVNYDKAKYELNLTRKANPDGTLVPLVKNKTYTASFAFIVRPTSGTETLTTLPATASLSVKVTDVAPKVTVKLGTLNVFNNAIEAPSNPYPYNYEPVAVTITGANADDVSGLVFADLDFSEDDGIRFEYNHDEKTVTVYSKKLLRKGTIKPVITVEYASDFANVELAKTSKGVKVGTVSMKAVETSPAVKLAKTSATINSAAGAEVQVEVVPTNKKAPYDVSNIRTVGVFQKVGREVVPDRTVEVEVDDDGIITLRTLEPVAKSKKITLRVYFEYSNDDMYKDLAFTLNAKTLAVKLSKSSVDFNVKNESNVTAVPITVTPESDTVTLERVGVKVGKVETFYPSDGNGTVDVNGMVFSCDDAALLLVDADGVENLVKGNLKYNLYFTGVAKAVAFTVKVADKYQTVKLSKSSVSLNTTVTDYALVDLIYSDVSTELTNANLDIQCSRAVSVEYDEYDGQLEVSISPDAAKTETVLITVKDANTDPKKSTLKLTIKKVDKPIQMKLSVKGKLDSLDENSTVTAKVTFSGTLGCMTVKDLLTEFEADDYSLRGTSILEIRDWSYDAKNGVQLTIGWQSGANLEYGAAKYGVDVVVDNGVLAAYMTKAASVTAAEGKVKLTADTATLYHALPYEQIDLNIDAGNYNITNVYFANGSAFYTVEKLVDGSFAIRYTDENVIADKKLKAKDTASLSVTIEGSKKIHTVKVPIVNVEKKAVIQ